MAVFRHLVKPFKELVRSLPAKYNESSLNRKLTKAMEVYENYIGVKEIKTIQQNVLKAEKAFIESSKSRRSIQDDLLKVQHNLKQIRQKLDSMSRSEEAYLELITNEHKLMKTELNLLNELRSKEESERELFTSFSQRLREAHEFERLRQEKVKYLSILGSIIGAFLGILGTSINHALKMKDINKLVSALKAQMNTISETFTPINGETSQQQNESSPTNNLSDHDITTNLDSKLDNYNQLIIKEMSSLQLSLTTSQLELEQRIKMNNYITGMVTIGILALILPIISRLQGS